MDKYGLLKEIIIWNLVSVMTDQFSALKYISIKVDKALWHKGSSDVQKFHSIIKLHKNLCK